MKLSIGLLTLLLTAYVSKGQVVSAHEDVEAAVWNNPFVAVYIYKRELKAISENGSGDSLNILIAKNNLALAILHTGDFRGAYIALNEVQKSLPTVSKETPDEVIFQTIYFYSTKVELSIWQNRDTTAIQDLLHIKSLRGNLRGDGVKADLLYLYYSNRLLEKLKITNLIEVASLPQKELPKDWPYSFFLKRKETSIEKLTKENSKTLDYLELSALINHLLAEKNKLPEESFATCVLSLNKIRKANNKNLIPLMSYDIYSVAIDYYLEKGDTANVFMFGRSAFNYAKQNNMRREAALVAHQIFAGLGTKYPTSFHNAFPDFGNYIDANESKINFLLLSEMISFNKETSVSLLKDSDLTRINYPFYIKLSFIAIAILTLLIGIQFYIIKSPIIKPRKDQ